MKLIEESNRRCTQYQVTIKQLEDQVNMLKVDV